MSLIDELNKQYGKIKTENPERAERIDKRASSDVLGFYSTGDKYGIRYTTKRKIKVVFNKGKLVSVDS